MITNDQRSTAVPRATGYSFSQRFRRRVEEIVGTKTVALFRKTRLRGVQRTDFASRLAGAAYNLRRMTNLLPQPT